MGDLSPKRSALHERQWLLPSPRWRNELRITSSNVRTNGQWPQRPNREVNQPIAKDTLPHDQQHSIDVPSLLLLVAAYASIRSHKDRKFQPSSASTSTTASAWGIGCWNSGFVPSANTRSLHEWLQVYHDALVMFYSILLYSERWLSNRSSIATSPIRKFTLWRGIKTHRLGLCSMPEGNLLLSCNKPWRLMLLLVRASTSTILNISPIKIDFCTLRMREGRCSWGEFIPAVQIS